MWIYIIKDLLLIPIYSFFYVSKVVQISPHLSEMLSKYICCLLKRRAWGSFTMVTVHITLSSETPVCPASSSAGDPESGLNHTD